MNLADIVEPIPLKVRAGERWAGVGPEANALQLKINAPDIHWLEFSPEIVADLDGLLLAGALSSMAEAQTWLHQLILQMNEAATLFVIDWQDDGPLTYG